MQDLGFEQILILLLFFLFPVLQIAVERLRRRSAPPSADTESENNEPWEPKELSWTEAPLPDTPRVIERPSVSARDQAAVPAHRRAGLQSRRRDGRSELRRAIVLSVILGPCRANDPPP
ncbi:MAG: hypothetical protein MUF20_08140 [Methylotetracoccus sp.]|nr:hypothetical protein [Methylotetracoccus sp.]